LTICCFCDFCKKQLTGIAKTQDGFILCFEQYADCPEASPYEAGEKQSAKQTCTVTTQQLFILVLPVNLWGNALKLFENAYVIAGIGIAEFRGYLGYGLAAVS